MKKIALLLVSLAMVAASAIAQQDAGINSTFTYKTTQSGIGGTSTFTWNIYNHGTLISAPGANYTVVSGAGTANYKIQWLIAGDYDVVVGEVSSNGCTNPTTDKTQEVIVAANAINFAAYTNTPACWNASAQVLPVNFTYVPGTSDYPIVITADVTLNGVLTSGQTFTIATAAAPLQISVAGFLDNTTTGDVTNSVHITATTFNGNLITVGATNTVSQTVFAKPSTNGITVQ
jgi:hypothetical protein